MPYGYKFQIGMQRVTEPDPNARHGPRFGAVVVVVLGLVAAALLWWPARTAPAAAPAPAAHIAAVPTAPAKASPPPVVVHVTGHTGAVCFLPGGKTINPVTLAVVP